MTAERQQFFNDCKSCQLHFHFWHWIVNKSNCCEANFHNIWSKHFFVDWKSSFYCSLTMRQRRSFNVSHRSSYSFWVCNSSSLNLKAGNLSWWYFDDTFGFRNELSILCQYSLLCQLFSTSLQSVSWAPAGTFLLHFLVWTLWFLYPDLPTS